MSDENKLTPEQKDEFAKLLAGKDIKPEIKNQETQNISVAEAGHLSPMATPGMSTFVERLEAERGIFSESNTAEQATEIQNPLAQADEQTVVTEPIIPDKEQIAKADANLVEAGSGILDEHSDSEYQPTPEDWQEYGQYLDEEEAIFLAQQDESPHLFEQATDAEPKEFSKAAQDMFDEHAKKSKAVMDEMTKAKGKDIER